MQTELDKIVKWLSANKLSTNTSKTKIVLFKGKNKSQNQQISLRINNYIIKQVSSVRFLGLIIDEGLTWKEHIDSVSKNIIKSSGLIAKRHANKNSLKLIYYALVYPYLTYGNQVWGNTYPTRLKKLFNIQKKIVRLICFKLYTGHSEPLFFNLRILNVYKINDYLCSLFMYGIIMVKNYQISTFIISSKIKKCITIIQEIVTIYM